MAERAFERRGSSSRLIEVRAVDAPGERRCLVGMSISVETNALLHAISSLAENDAIFESRERGTTLRSGNGGGF